MGILPELRREWRDPLRDGDLSIPPDDGRDSSAGGTGGGVAEGGVGDLPPDVVSK